jgi:hypothetical protein
MPVKIARSTPRPSFGLRELLVASHISRLASRDAAKSLLSTLVSESSGECRLKHAAHHHEEAAKHHNAGHREKAAHHAHTARGHIIHARGHAEEAVKAHTEEHGKK